jgi:tyrosinase
VDQYVKTEARLEGTFSNNWREDDTIDTELTPFTRSKDWTMWTSRGVRSTTTFGYVYPETQSWLYPTKHDIFQQLQSIYPNASLATNIKADKDKRVAATEALKSRANTLLALEAASLKTASLVQAASTGTSDVHQSLAAVAQQVEVPTDRSLADLVQDNKYLEWLVDLRAEKHTLGGNFAVHVFLGDPDDENPPLYIADPNHVATFSTFGSDEVTGCESCKKGQEARLQVTGQIPITLALVERYFAAKINSITPDDVIPYLQKNLHWRVTDKYGARGSRADVRGLLVSVVSNEATLPEGPSELPKYAPNVTPWAAATTRENGEGRGRGTGYTEG